MPNSPERNQVARNTLWLLASEFISRLIIFAVVVWLANYLGSREYGELTYAFAVANLLVIVADFGLSTYLVKELSRDLSQTKKFISELLAIKILLSSITLVLLVVAAIAISNLNKTVIIFGGAAIVLNNGRMFIEAFFRSHQRMALEAATKITASIILAAIISWLIVVRENLTSIAIAYFIAAILSLLTALIILRQKISVFRIKFLSRVQIKTILTASWPFALSLACNYVFNYMDSAMLGFFGQTQAVGWYNAAYKPIFFVTALAGMIINAFFPLISQQFKHAPHQISATVNRLLHINMLVAAPLAVGGVLVAPKLIMWLYAPEYAPAVLAFQILVISTALIYLWAVFGNSLQACDRQRIYLRGFSWGVLINTALNLLLIPRWSLYGAAAATMFTQLFLLIYMYVRFRVVAIVSLWYQLWRPLLAAAIMGAILYFVADNFSWWAMLLTGAVCYFLVMILIKGVTKDEIKFLRSIWQQKN